MTDPNAREQRARGWRPFIHQRDVPTNGSWFVARATKGGWAATRIVHYANRYDRLPTDGSGWIWPSEPTEWMPFDEFAAMLAFADAQPQEGAGDEARTDAWNDFTGEYLTDGKGYATADVWKRCQAAFDAAWPNGPEAALHRALAALSTPPAPAAPVQGGTCAASPDHADILETIQNAADDWQKNGYTSALAEVRDMANVGRALMEALPKGYSYMNCPSEIVADLQNERDEALAAAPVQAEVERDRYDCAIALLRMVPLHRLESGDRAEIQSFLASLPSTQPADDGRLREALEAQEDAEDARESCPNCEGEGQWEHCPSCSITFGRAIDKRRQALAESAS